ncbi:GH25 family lysozyme [Arthrobacter sp. HY1533]|uniref:GH25 family lysozyme n=1 Tax=Arthrobacter sp. HY1533 TaxID=2970919 RepID=UPI0022BA1131|nr:GH25 family lysozyme [Arthrobacter sp. HY1533]
MFSTSAPRFISHTPEPSPHRLVRRACASVVAVALILGMGALPAGAAPAPTPAVDAPTPSSLASPTLEGAAPEAGSTPTQVPDAGPTGQATATATAETMPPANPGAFMGQGASRALRGVAANAPMSALLGEVEAAQPYDARALPSGVQGMDVSGWQADPETYSVSQVNWAQHWSMGSRFVYAKATEGDYFVDASRPSHLKGATGVGMLTGAYHFALPGQSSAVAQADFFLRNGGSWAANGNTLPPLLDMENNPYTNPSKRPYYGNNCYNMTPSSMVAWIKAFSNRVLAQTGRLPAIYTNYYWWQECTGNSKDFAKQPLHIAAYGASSPWIPGGWQDYQFWQYSDSGPFAGDSNVWNGTLAGLKAFAGASDSPATAPSIPSPADLVAADSSGQLWNYPGTSAGSYGPRKLIGTGWTGLRSLNVIDWDADGTLDIVAQWTSGRLSFYRGQPTGGFSTPLTLAASGWGTAQLTLGYWLNSSNRPQILAKSPDGTLRLWRNDEAGTISGGNVIGSGWGQFNVTMVDFDGDGKQDLLAQDTAGSLKLYRSNGTGGFVDETRKVVGVGWNGFTSLSVASGFAGPGTVGLVARTKAGALYYYPVPGNSRFGSAVAVGQGFTTFLIAGGETINVAPPLVSPSPTPTPVPPITGPSIQAMSDVVTVDGSGVLWRRPVAASVLGQPKQIGAGFNGAKSVHVVDWDADGVLDLMVQWENGKLTLYRGARLGGFSAVALGSSGWNGVDMTVGQWVKGAKYPSIVARSISGDLLSYTTINGSSVSAGIVVAKGMTRVHPVISDFDGDGNADILAFDNIGRINLLRSTGKGTLISEARPVVGNGWKAMTSIGSAIGHTANGSSGLLARTSAGSLTYYPFNKSTFGTPVVLANGWNAYTIAGSERLIPSSPLTSLADVVTIDASGVVWNRTASGDSKLSAAFPIQGGWRNVKSQHVTDWNADGVPDLLVQWENGTVDVYSASPQGGFSAPVRIGYNGWAGIDLMVGPWMAGSRYPSLVGRTSTGDLVRWENKNGRDLSPGVKIGIGWKSLELAMVDFDKDGRADILGVDTGGTMRLYRSNGLGTFMGETRPVVGTGWSGFRQFTGISAFAGQGTTGVMATFQNGALRYYPLVSSRRWGTPVDIQP